MQNLSENARTGCSTFTFAYGYYHIRKFFCKCLIYSWRNWLAHISTTSMALAGFIFLFGCATALNPIKQGNHNVPKDIATQPMHTPYLAEVHARQESYLDGLVDILRIDTRNVIHVCNGVMDIQNSSDRADDTIQYLRKTADEISERQSIYMVRFDSETDTNIKNRYQLQVEHDKFLKSMISKIIQEIELIRDPNTTKEDRDEAYQSLRIQLGDINNLELGIRDRS